MLLTPQVSVYPSTERWYNGQAGHIQQRIKFVFMKGSPPGYQIISNHHSERAAKKVPIFTELIINLLCLIFFGVCMITTQTVSVSNSMEYGKGFSQGKTDQNSHDF